MHIPFDVEQVFGTKARVAVAGTLNGVPFRNSLMPIGDGTHYMNINQELKAAANTRAGELVHVILRLDTAERVVAVPEEMQVALSQAPQAAAFFASLAYSHKKEFTDWIESAKKPETRASRIAKAIEMLNAGERKDR